LFNARCYVERGIATASRPSVCLSVRPSVTLRNRGRIGCKSSKIISHSVRLVSSLSAADPNIMDLFQGERPEIWNRGGDVGVRRTKALISLKCGKIALRLLLSSQPIGSPIRAFDW